MFSAIAGSVAGMNKGGSSVRGDSKESNELKRRDLSDRWQEMRTGQMTVAVAGTFQELGIKEMLLNKSLKPRDYKHG